jgi:hypothetical protein
LGQYPCHPVLGDSQYFSFADEGSLRNEYMCATDGEENKVAMYSCKDYGNNQQWKWEEGGLLRHVKSGKCMTAPNAEPGSEVELRDCSKGDESQVWEWEFKRED